MNENMVELSYFDYERSEDVPFKMYKNVPVSKMQDFVFKVVSSIVTEEYYYSLYRDVVFDFMLIGEFTDIDVASIVNDSDDVYAKIEEYINSNNIATIVKEELGTNILDKLNNAVNDNIEYKTGIHHNAFIDKLNTFLSFVSNYLSEYSIEDITNILSAELSNDAQSNNGGD